MNDQAWLWARRGLIATGLTLLAWTCFKCFASPENASTDGWPHLADCIKSPGRVAPARFESAFNAFRDECREGKACTAAPIGIGHVAASLRRYPKSVSEDEAKAHGWLLHPTHAEDVNALMEQAFSIKNLAGIEIDAHALPDTNPDDCDSIDDECAFILHDDPPWSVVNGADSPGKRYLERNTLTKVLRHFAKRHAGAGRRVFLELKEPVDCTGLLREGKCRARMATIARQVLAVDAVQSLQRGLDFVSFSRDALDAVHEALAGTSLDGRVGYQFIAGVSCKSLGLSCMLALTSHGVGLLGAEDREWLSDSAWLSGVWFSPRCFDDAATTLSAINVIRRQEGRPALHVGVSAYQQEQSDVLDWLHGNYNEAVAGLPVIDSFIFDIDH